MKVLLVTIFIFLQAGCEKHYHSLEENFPFIQELEGEIIDSKSIVLVSQNLHSSYEFKNMVNTKLSKSVIELDIQMIGYKKTQISAADVSGCSKTCFDNDWHADLLLGTVGMKIGFDKSEQIFDWCWNNRLPIISNKNKRDFLYNKRAFPKIESYKGSKSEYIKKINLSCNGE